MSGTGRHPTVLVVRGPGPAAGCRPAAPGLHLVRSPDVDTDRGSGTVLALALVAVVLLLGGALALLAGAHGAAGRAQAAADLAALAGAGVLPREGTSAACGVAEETAARNGARMVRCEPDGADVLRVDALVAAGAGEATRSARAGPASARQGSAEGSG